VLFKPPFTCVAIGAIGSGKTSFGYSLLDKHYANYFDEVVVISGTIDSKESWEKLHQKKVVFLDGFDEEAFAAYIKQLEEDQEERKRKGKFPVRVVLVMDDIIMEGFNKNRAGVIEKLMMTCRHYFISIILMLQHSKQISPAMRNQIFYWALFRLTKNDLEKIASEHGNQLSKDGFIKMHSDIMEKGRHEFMIVDYKAPFEERFRHRFTSIIDTEPYKNL
jgi:KaiC/GvpD/RAD55 family RecA-like ATPase